jgi:hypothetical protein
MEFMILLEICVLIIAGVAWVGRRRPSVDDYTLAERADRAARGDRLRQENAGPPDQSGGGVSF